MRFSTIGLRGIGLLLAAVSASPAAGPLAFEKHVLTDQHYCDGINAGDINRDGRPDIVAGPSGIEGPGFRRTPSTGHGLARRLPDVRLELPDEEPHFSFRDEDGRVHHTLIECVAAQFDPAAPHLQAVQLQLVSWIAREIEGRTLSASVRAASRWSPRRFLGSRLDLSDQSAAVCRAIVAWRNLELGPARLLGVDVGAIRGCLCTSTRSVTYQNYAHSTSHLTDCRPNL